MKVSEKTGCAGDREKALLTNRLSPASIRRQA